MTLPTRATARIRASLGFTLIELMVVVGTIGILAAIAYPSFMSQMRKGRRADAEAVLMDIAQRQQAYLLDSRVYAGDVATLNLEIPSNITDFYTFTIVAGDGPPRTFDATATPVDGSAQAGDPTLTIDQAGTKTPAANW